MTFLSQGFRKLYYDRYTRTHTCARHAALLVVDKVIGTFESQLLFSFLVCFNDNSLAAKSKNISLCGEIMKLGTLVGDPCKIIFRLGPNSERPPGGRHLEF